MDFIKFVIDILILLLAVGFLWLVLKELARSQKDFEDIDPLADMLRIDLEVFNVKGHGHKTYTFHGETIEELQDTLNLFPMFRLKRAGVFKGKTLTHIMNVHGVLEAV